MSLIPPRPRSPAFPVAVRKVLISIVNAAVIDALADAAFLKCCPSCEHFDLEKEECRLAKARPPAETIAFGCELWVEEND